MITVLHPNIPFSYWKDVVLESGRKVKVLIRHEKGLPVAKMVKEADE